MRDNRHDYIYDSTDPKANESVGKLGGFVMTIVFFLGVLQVVSDTMIGWYRDAMQWGSETAAYLASFWPL